jgi:hypothetical protein
MDNASKALIIAGAILITILVATFAVSLFKGAAEVTNNSNNAHNTVGITTYNSQFEQYFGSSRNKEQVKSLIRKINSNNDSDNIYIGCSMDLDEVSDSASSTFSVSGSYNEEGYLSYVEITPYTM